MNDFNYQHGGNINAYARKYNLSISDIIDASASLVPLEIPQFLAKTLNSELTRQGFRYYPDRDLLNLREVIGYFHKISPDNILPGNGASELITWSGYEAAKYGLNCLPVPGFVDYERSLNCWNAQYVFNELPKKNFSNTAQDFPIEPDGDVIWITNPHNPTGQLWTRNSLEKLVKKYKLLICDEAFLPLTLKGENESLIPLINEYQNIIVIRSLTKLIGIAGLRLGYMISSHSKLKKLSSKRDPWPLNSFAISAGITILSDSKKYYSWERKIHNWLINETDFIYKKLSNIKEIKVHQSSTNFFLIESENSLASNIKYLETKGILIRECSSFRSLNEKWARISLRKRKENKIIAKEIQNSFL